MQCLPPACCRLQGVLSALCGSLLMQELSCSPPSLDLSHTAQTLSPLPPRTPQRRPVDMGNGCSCAFAQAPGGQRTVVITPGAGDDPVAWARSMLAAVADARMLRKHADMCCAASARVWGWSKLPDQRAPDGQTPAVVLLVPGNCRRLCDFLPKVCMGARAGSRSASACVLFRVGCRQAARRKPMDASSQGDVCVVCVCVSMLVGWGWDMLDVCVCVYVCMCACVLCVGGGGTLLAAQYLHVSPCAVVISVCMRGWGKALESSC